MICIFSIFFIKNYGSITNKATNTKTMNNQLLKNIVIPQLLLYLDETSLHNLHNCNQDMHKLISHAINTHIVKIEGFFLDRNRQLYVVTSIKKKWNNTAFIQSIVPSISYINDPIDEYINGLPINVSITILVKYYNYTISKHITIPIKQIYTKLPRMETKSHIHKYPWYNGEDFWEVNNSKLSYAGWNHKWIMRADWHTINEIVLKDFMKDSTFHGIQIIINNSSCS